MYAYIVRNIKPLENEFVMVEVSEALQLKKFQSLCHDLLFHCKFFFGFCLCFQTKLWNSLFIVFFMFYNMVDKCMTQWQKFSVFWQQVGCVEIYIYIYQHYQPAKITLHCSILIIEYLVSYVIWIMDDVICAIFCGFNDYWSRNCHWEKYCVW